MYLTNLKAALINKIVITGLVTLVVSVLGLIIGASELQAIVNFISANGV